MREQLEKEVDVAQAVKQSKADLKAIETARSWAQMTSRADNRAVYGADRRDYEIWYEREIDDEKQAS